ncbi:MAG: HdeD family acid-resistance protein [Stellaceae bacterium]
MSINTPTSAADLVAAFKKSISDHWRLFLAEGVVLVVLGLAAIVIPPIAGLATTIIIGWLFLIGGTVGLVTTFGAHQAPGFAWSLFSAILALLAGIVLLWNPWQGLATLTYVLIAFFIIDGILIIALALQHRRELTGRWEWMMIGGVMDLVLALIIISGLPGTLAWALGLLVGIDLVWGGMSLIAMALSARNAAV